MHRMLKWISLSLVFTLSTSSVLAGIVNVASQGITGTVAFVGNGLSYLAGSAAGTAQAGAEATGRAMTFGQQRTQEAAEWTAARGQEGYNFAQRSVYQTNRFLFGPQGVIYSSNDPMVSDNFRYDESYNQGYKDSYYISTGSQPR